LHVGEPYRPDFILGKEFDVILGNWDSPTTQEYYWPEMFHKLCVSYPLNVDGEISLTNHFLITRLRLAKDVVGRY
jgi:hypothetical protein